MPNIIIVIVGCVLLFLCGCSNGNRDIRKYDNGFIQFVILNPGNIYDKEKYEEYKSDLQVFEQNSLLLQLMLPKPIEPSPIYVDIGSCKIYIESDDQYLESDISEKITKWKFIYDTNNHFNIGIRHNDNKIPLFKSNGNILINWVIQIDKETITKFQYESNY
jgi:hypothetical protein